MAGNGPGDDAALAADVSGIFQVCFASGATFNCARTLQGPVSYLHSGIPTIARTCIDLSCDLYALVGATFTLAQNHRCHRSARSYCFLDSDFAIRSANCGNSDRVSHRESVPQSQERKTPGAG